MSTNNEEQLNISEEEINRTANKELLRAEPVIAEPVIAEPVEEEYSFTGQSNDIGCLFLLNGRRYIYGGKQLNKYGKMVPTFYGLDSLDGYNNEENNLNNLNINNFQNRTQLNKSDALLEIVQSPIYSEYKTGIPLELRRTPLSRSLPSSFYQIRDVNGSPIQFKNLSSVTGAVSQNSYVYRIGSNGPSIKYIQDGKIIDINNFVKDYKKMVLKKQIAQPVVENPGSLVGVE